MKNAKAVLFPLAVLAVMFLAAVNFVRAQSYNEPPPPISSDYYLNPDNFKITPLPTISSLGAGNRLGVLSIPTSNLVGEWKFEEGIGNTVADTSGKGNNGTWSGIGSHWSDGKAGKAGSFNGTDDYVKISATSGSSLDIGTNPVSISAWVNTNSVTSQQAILLRGTSDGIGAGGEGYGIWVNSNGKINVGSVGGGNFDSVDTISANTWYHIVAITDGDKSKVYINGINKTPSGVNISVFPSDKDLFIGVARNKTDTDFGKYFSGKIDQVRIYNTALSPQQVVEDLNLGLQTSYTVSDDFTGTSINNQNWWPPSPLTDIANNQLKMQLGTAVKNGGTDIWPKKKFKGDFQAEIDLVSYQMIPSISGYTDARFWMNNDWAGWISANLVLNDQNDPRGNLTCTIHYLEGGNPVDIEIGRDNLDNVPVTANLRLRITRVGNTASCSLNSGSGFVVLGSKEVPEWADRVFAPYISSWKGNAENVSSTATWDNFTASGTLAETVGFWYMDEGSGQTVADSSGKNNHGTATGTSIVYGKKGNGRSFNGLSDYIALSSQPLLKDGFTFESWVNFDSGNNYNNYQEIFNNNQFFIRKDNNSEGNKISAFRLSDNSVEPRVSSTTIPVPGKWYHVTTIWNGSTLRMYIDGKLEGTVDQQGALTTNVVQAQFGRGEQTSLTSNPLAGKLDDVRIYNYVRTPFQIIQEDMLGWAQTTQTVTDNFDAASLDTNKWNISKTNPAISINQTNGGVYMTIPGSVDTGGAILELKQKISADFVMDIDVGSLQMDTANGQNGTAEINVWQPNKFFALRWVRDNPDVSVSYIDYYKVDNGQVDDGPAYFIRSDSRPRMRLMRIGKTFIGVVMNGYGWVPVFSVDGFRGDEDKLSFTLNKGVKGTSTGDVKVYFDNLWGVYNNNCVRGLKGNLDCGSGGLVDTADFELFRQSFGKPIGSVSVGNNMFSPDLFVDVNDQIDTADFEIFRSNFGRNQ